MSFYPFAVAALSKDSDWRHDTNPLFNTTSHVSYVQLHLVRSNC